VHATAPSYWLRWGFMSYLPGLASNCDPPKFSLLNSKVYRQEPLHQSEVAPFENRWCPYVNPSGKLDSHRKYSLVPHINSLINHKPHMCQWAHKIRMKLKKILSPTDVKTLLLPSIMYQTHHSHICDDAGINKTAITSCMKV
jgi:hypothetical protein